MKREVLMFAGVLLALCVSLTAVRLLVWGIDHERLATVVQSPIVWAMTLGELLIGGGCCAIAWNVARAYNSAEQSGRSFPSVGRAVAFGFTALGATSLGDAVCHYIPAYWSLALVKLVCAGTLGWAALVWMRSVPELRRWFDLLRQAERDSV